MVTFKKIIQALELDYPFVYYVFKDQDIRKNELLYLSVFSEEQKKEYEALDDEQKKKYKTTTAKIYIPKISIYKYENLCIQSGGYDFEYTVNRVQRLAAVKENDKCLAACLFMILHEIGHWNDLKEKNFSVWDYAIKDSEESKKVFEFKKETIKFMQSTNEKSKQINKANEYMEKYYNTPIEKRANEYAEKIFPDYYHLLLEKDIV